MRQAIESTALDLFQKEGYGAISMRRLATEIGCSPMTLYSYFENKIDILRALWVSVFHDLFEGLHQQASEVTDPAERLHVLSKGYVDYWLEHTEHYRMVFMADGVSQPDVSVFIEDKNTLRRFTAFYEYVADAGSNADSKSALKEKGDFLVSALHGIAHCQITMSGFQWTKTDRLIDQAVKAVIDG